MHVSSYVRGGLGGGQVFQKKEKGSQLAVKIAPEVVYESLQGRTRQGNKEPYYDSYSTAMYRAHILRKLAGAL